MRADRQAMLDWIWELHLKGVLDRIIAARTGATINAIGNCIKRLRAAAGMPAMSPHIRRAESIGYGGVEVGRADESGRRIGPYRGMDGNFDLNYKSE